MKVSHLQKAIDQLKDERKVLDMAIAKLEAQQVHNSPKPARVRKPALVEKAGA